MAITPYLKLMAERNASDLFFSPGAPVNVKIDGRIRALGTAPLAPGTVKALAYGIISPAQAEAFERTLELNLALSVRGLGRFRANLYRSRGETAMVIRYVGDRIPSVEALRLPAILKDLILAPRGLILVAGAAGSGKSTTLAAMIEHRNRRRHGHILTIEDPVEFIHRHGLSIVDQREVGFDTLSYRNALKNALREAPDVILIGEIRDRQTMQQAIAYAETGHLCLSTLHASNAHQALDRIVGFFPASAHRRLLQGLAASLRAVVSQRLVRGVDASRIPAVEVLLHSPYTAQLVAKGDTDGLKAAMAKGAALGMQTCDQALYELWRQGRVSVKEALANADARHELLLRIRLSRRHGAQAQGADARPGKPPMDTCG